LNNVREIDHPLVIHHLTKLRDKTTTPAEFRRLVRRLSFLLAYEATQDLALEDVAVETPLKATMGKQLQGRLGLVPILRAGLGMVDPVLELLPDAEVWHLGLYRDEATLEPVEYYQKLASGRPVDIGFVLDPMLATGGSINAAVTALKHWGTPTIRVLSILAAPEGIRAITNQFPEVCIHVCAVDERLNEVGYIVPGLGDAGDRSFNT
jgi:uracil phosphoribosyltransferase